MRFRFSTSFADSPINAFSRPQSVSSLLVLICQSDFVFSTLWAQSLIFSFCFLNDRGDFAVRVGLFSSGKNKFDLNSLLTIEGMFIERTWKSFGYPSMPERPMWEDLSTYFVNKSGLFTSEITKSALHGTKVTLVRGSLAFNLGRLWARPKQPFFLASALDISRALEQAQCVRTNYLTSPKGTTFLHYKQPPRNRAKL